MKENPTELKGKIDSYTIRVGNFNTSFSVMEDKHNKPAGSNRCCWVECSVYNSVHTLLKCRWEVL